MAVLQVVGEAGQAGGDGLFAGLGQQGDPGADVGVEVGVGAAPVGGGESVGAVVRDGDRVGVRAAEQVGQFGAGRA
ncbi:MAG: hypothetical protein H5T76_33680 [Streptomyces sp.]|nr:hypothetical protein [Streptomyces sp.]